ncbi:MAG: LysR family transcriptional regulator [Nitrososphaerota archaeon]|nr:LysR family transcriptional regulator [Nitrososphaerota archaeon]MDG7013776.1 LysR family transcriptional regulator [Nitrososphaerota archaeon]MDG7025120.1 LysR family transcriptional regulator [Nitrososphaerota archaeon]
MARSEVEPVPHLSLQSEKETVLDEVDAMLLQALSEKNSLTEAAREAGVSYRNAWDRIRRAEARSGMKILETSTGGREGGSSRLTKEGQALLREFRRVKDYLSYALDDREAAGNVRYKLSARNAFDAKVTKIEGGEVTCMVRMLSVSPFRLTSIISRDAVEDLGLREGDIVKAVVKATEVMVAKRLPTKAKGANGGRTDSGRRFGKQLDSQARSHTHAGSEPEG